MVMGVVPEGAIWGARMFRSSIWVAVARVCAANVTGVAQNTID